VIRSHSSLWTKTAYCKVGKHNGGSALYWRVIVSQFLIAVDMMSFAHTDSCVDSATIFKSSTLSSTHSLSPGGSVRQWRI